MQALRRILICGLVLLGAVTACSDNACVAIAYPSASVQVLAADTGDFACDAFVFVADADRASVLAVCPRPDCCNGEYTVGDACCHGGYTISAEDGTHTITANAPGYKSLSHTVRVTNPKACEPGNPTKLTFKLQPE